MTRSEIDDADFDSLSKGERRGASTLRSKSSSSLSEYDDDEVDTNESGDRSKSLF